MSGDFVKSPCDSISTVHPTGLSVLGHLPEALDDPLHHLVLGLALGDLVAEHPHVLHAHRLREVDEAAALVELRLAHLRVLLVHAGRRAEVADVEAERREVLLRRRPAATRRTRAPSAGPSRRRCRAAPARRSRTCRRSRGSVFQLQLGHPSVENGNRVPCRTASARAAWRARRRGRRRASLMNERRVTVDIGPPRKERPDYMSASTPRSRATRTRARAPPGVRALDHTAATMPAGSMRMTATTDSTVQTPRARDQALAVDHGLPRAVLDRRRRALRPALLLRLLRQGPRLDPPAGDLGQRAQQAARRARSSGSSPA